MLLRGFIRWSLHPKHIFRGKLIEGWFRLHVRESNNSNELIELCIWAICPRNGAFFGLAVIQTARWVVSPMQTWQMPPKWQRPCSHGRLGFSATWLADGIFSVKVTQIILIDKYIIDRHMFWISDYAKLYIHSPYTTNILKEPAKESNIPAKRELFHARLPRQATWKVPDDLPFFDARLIVETSALFIAASFRIRLLDMHWSGKCVSKIRQSKMAPAVWPSGFAASGASQGAAWLQLECSGEECICGDVQDSRACVFFGIFLLVWMILHSTSVEKILFDCHFWFQKIAVVPCLSQCWNSELPLRFWFQSFSTSSDTSFLNVNNSIFNIQASWKCMNVHIIRTMYRAYVTLHAQFESV